MYKKKTFKILLLLGFFSSLTILQVHATSCPSDRILSRLEVERWERAVKDGEMRGRIVEQRQLDEIDFVVKRIENEVVEGVLSGVEKESTRRFLAQSNIIANIMSMEKMRSFVERAVESNMSYSDRNGIISRKVDKMVQLGINTVTMEEECEMSRQSTERSRIELEWVGARRAARRLRYEEQQRRVELIARGKAAELRNQEARKEENIRIGLRIVLGVGVGIGAGVAGIAIYKKIKKK